MGLQMETKEYRTVDKAGWGDGLWQNEPDKMQWQDEATGLPCLIVRGPVGALCGYVGVDERHPAFGLSHNGTPYEEDRAHFTAMRESMRSAFGDRGGAKSHEMVREAIKALPVGPQRVGIAGDRISEVDVHGGLTFASACSPHGDEAANVCHVPGPGETDRVWWFGFDCAHAGDLCPQMNMHLKQMDAILPMPPSLAGYRDNDEYRDVAYVKEQCAMLAKQLVAIADEARASAHT